MSSINLSQVILGLIPMILSLTVHECAHAWSAFKLGDDTAEREGRLSLNPLVHIDPLGTIVLPVALALFNSSFMFGWAKPVPINPLRFDRRCSMRTGMMASAAAGPLANVVMAVISTVVYGVLLRFAPYSAIRGSGMAELLRMLININVVLALFNMLPVYPLDGSRVADGLMPERFRPLWDSINRFAPFLLMAVVFYGGAIISGPSIFVLDLLYVLRDAIAF